jgi:uncharacterized protein YutE (UPF0331/DUF86 family)
MPSDVLLSKAEALERCVARAREEYNKDPGTFGGDYTRQDAAILNIERACETALDMGQHTIRVKNLGIAQSSREVFEILAQKGIITNKLCENLKNMVGFRNIAVHSYQTLQLPILEDVIQNHLGDLLELKTVLLK